MNMRRNGQRGNALVEFGITSAVLLPLLAGSFGFGYTFYKYNLLVSAVSNGSRYASYRTYRCLNGNFDVEKVKASIRNVTVYNTPTPTDASVPVLPGLTTAKIDVTFALSSTQLPLSVTVGVNNFAVDALFQYHTFRNKPKITAPYLGRYAAEEAEP